MLPKHKMQGNISLTELNARIQNNMGGFMGMEFVEYGEGYLKSRMPITNLSRQPLGLLNGGASMALAEITGSTAANLYLDRSKFVALGLEINANHLRGVKEGYVYATASPLHIGRSTHVWEIKITNDQDQLVCISRLTMAVVEINQFMS